MSLLTDQNAPSDPAVQGSWIRTAVRGVRRWSQTDPVATALYKVLVDRGRLDLPLAEPEKLSPTHGSVIIPVLYPLFAGEDAPLIDLVFLLNLARGRNARRILEVGTYRARTTYALHLNCPGATIVSYDIQALPSDYRTKLLSSEEVSLRVTPFQNGAGTLRNEERFDLIFVDGSHRLEDVVEDTRLALRLVAPKGIVVWHDYRPNDYHTAELRVPEALSVFKDEYQLWWARGTTCAVYLADDSESQSLQCSN